MRIDFYLLADATLESKLLFACQLLEKAYARGHRIYVNCNDQETAELLDERLWTFKEESFIPHHLQGEGPEPPPPIQIGFDHSPKGFNDLLLNLSQEVPVYYSQFKRILELVPGDEVAKEICRHHFRFYREKNCVIHTHQIGSE